MRPITRITICAITAAAIAAPAVAAADFFLKLDNPKGESAAKASGGKQIEIQSWSFGATNAGRTNLNSSKSNREIAVSDPGAEGSKRQHGPVTISKPLERGSVTVQNGLPGCTVGARYGGAQLGGGATLYTFKDIMVTSCALDSISFDYASYRESPTRQSQK